MFKNEKRAVVKVGILSALMIFLIMLPSMLQNHGVYIICGDYIDQYIPRLIKARKILFDSVGTWDWYNYLGAPINVLNSVFSLNFVCLLFPKEIIPYAVTYMHLLRFALVAMSAYAYLSYMVKEYKHAVLGALLYTFSSYTFINFEFMQFIDALWAFPLILLAAEKLFRCDAYKHQLVLASFLSCVTSFYFFVFSTISFVVYFLCRYFFSNEWKENRSFKLFVMAVWEYLLGFICASVVVLPFIYKLFNSAGSAQAIGTKTSGSWLYGNDFFARLTSFFLPAASNRFSTLGFSRWRSIACYVPIFSVSFVLASWFNKKQKDNLWLKLICVFSVLCIVWCGISLVYNAFSTTYLRYAYAMVLFFILATLSFLENYNETLAKRSVYITIVCFAGVIGVFFFCKQFLMGKLSILNTLIYDASVEGNLSNFYLGFSLIAAFCMYACLIAFVHSQKVREHILPITVILLLVYGCSYTVVNLKDESFLDYYPETNISVKEQVDLYFFDLPEFEDGKDYRIDYPMQLRNYGYATTKPSISTFESVKNYSSVEMSKNLNMFLGKVSIFPVGIDNELRTLLGVKYYYDLYPKDGLPIPLGFTYIKTDQGIKVYQNEHYMGMGFSYNNYITRSEFESLNLSKDSAQLMLNTLIVENADEAFVKDVLTHGETSAAGNRILFDHFETTSKGFKAEITAQKEEIVYVSVPYENEGWTATINGKKAEFIKANIGCMAFKVNPGQNNIVFEYRMPAITIGTYISCIGALLAVLYLAGCYFIKRRRTNKAYVA